MAAVVRLDNIRALERALAPYAEPGAFPVEHHFAAGLYARAMFIPAGGLLTGKMHASEHLCIVAAGDITVWTEGASDKLRLTAPCVLVSAPGAKRVGLAHADTTFITVHATDETDPAKLEALLTLPEPALTAAEAERIAEGAP